MWGRAVTLTRLAGFDIRIDASWFLIAGLIVWSLSRGYFPTTLPNAGWPIWLAAAALSMLGLFASLILHELAHAVMARHHGLSISGITLFFFGGVAELDTEPGSPSVEWRVAIVGPLASLGLAALFSSSALAVQVLGLGAVVATVLGYLAALNLMLAVFNMIPAFPLDGGRVLRAVLWRRGGNLLQATRQAVSVSGVFAWGLIGLGIVALFSAGPATGLWPILIGVFIMALGQASLRQVEMQQVLGTRRVADLMTRDPVTGRPDQTLDDIINHVFLAHGISFAPVVEAGTLLGYVDLSIIRRIDREHWTTTIVDDVIESLSDDNALSPDLPAQALMDRITGGARRKFMVANDGALVGVVTLSDVTAHLAVSRQIAALR
jgi:Zn-dependent protease